jgi:enamine deaminase RidA (YjgF/YER057c/UK114 family)
VKTAGRFVPAVRTGNLIFISGHVSGIGDDPVRGKAGTDQTPERAYEGARHVGDALLATLERELGSLDRIVRIVKVLGFVTAAPDFTDMPAIVNGVSDRLIEVLGPRGEHARSAVGVATLPLGSTVEAELIAEVSETPA